MAEHKEIDKRQNYSKIPLDRFEQIRVVVNINYYRLTKDIKQQQTDLKTKLLKKGERYKNGITKYTA